MPLTTFQYGHKYSYSSRHAERLARTGRVPATQERVNGRLIWLMEDTPPKAVAAVRAPARKTSFTIALSPAAECAAREKAELQGLAVSTLLGRLCEENLCR